MKKWTGKEIEILKNNYETLSHKDLYKLLPNRTVRSIGHKIFKLKLTWLTPKQRFWKYVDKKSDDGCWHWMGSKIKNGYGQIKINNKMILSHRFSWELHNSKVPKDLYVLHKCDNPKCVNPSHLFLGTQQDNMHDMINKNRKAKGENHGNNKLTWDKVTQIRNLKGKLTQRKIAEKFNVNYTTIGRIHRNETWKGV